MLEFDKNPDDNFTLVETGKLQLLMEAPPDPIDISQYCIDYFEGEHHSVCFKRDQHTNSEARKTFHNA